MERLHNTLQRFEVPGDIKQTVWNQIAFLLFAITQAEDEAPEIGPMVNDVPGYVLIETISEFLESHPVTEKDADYDLILRWSYMLRMLYVFAYSQEPMMETGMGIITVSLRISDLWYSAGAWDEVMKISDTTIGFAEALNKTGRMPEHFSVMIGLLWYHRGVAQMNGYRNEKEQKKSYEKAVSYLEPLAKDDEEIKAVIADCRKTLKK